MGIGFTNLVSRPTRRDDELQRDEIEEGAALREKLNLYRPRTVAYTGIGVYRLFLATRKVEWGVQPHAPCQTLPTWSCPRPPG